MRIVRNQPVVQKLSQSLIHNESNHVAMQVSSPTLLTNWYLIDPDKTTLVPGLDNVDRYAGKDSQVVYNYVEGVPMGGVNDLTISPQFDEETGYDEEFTTSGIVYPNTVMPIPGSSFVIQGSNQFAIFIVTNINPVTLRSNPFIEITFKLWSRDRERLKQLERQVSKRYTVCLETLGTSESLVLDNGVKGLLDQHVQNYLDMAAIYTMLFYDKQKAAFVFNGLPDPETGERACFIDLTLWRYLFDEGIIIYDDIITYATGNGLRTVEPIFTACPDIYVDDHTYRRSILYRIYTKNTKNNFDEYRFPYLWNPPERITKYQGRNLWYLEGYLQYPGNEPFDQFYLWDDEFLCRIRNNDPYPPIEPRLFCRPDACESCTQHCTGKPVSCYNVSLRNAIIEWLNGEEIDWLSDDLEIPDVCTIENYYLIPILMGIYKQFIRELQSSGTTL